MGESKLKPCPFCGSSKVYMEYAPKHGARVVCKCGACGPYGSSGSEKTAKNSWNRRASPWQPIETAPKDYIREIFVCWSDTGEIDIAVWQDGGFANYLWTCGRIYDPQPTHWMPLPEVPKEDE